MSPVAPLYNIIAICSRTPKPILSVYHKHDTQNITDVILMICCCDIRYLNPSFRLPWRCWSLILKSWKLKHCNKCYVPVSSRKLNSLHLNYISWKCWPWGQKYSAHGTWSFWNWSDKASGSSNRIWTPAHRDGMSVLEDTLVDVVMNYIILT